MKELDPKGLRYFRAVLEHRSMCRAAEKLSVDIADVSQQIEFLEKEIGLTLFERRLGSRDKLIPTKAAAALSEYALESRAQQMRLASYLKELRNAQQNEIRISMGEAYAQVFRGEILNGFLRQYPEVNVNLRIDSTYGVISDLIEETIHFGLAWNPPTDRHIQQHARMQQPVLRLVAGKNHPLSHYPHREIRFSDIPRYPMIALMPDDFAVGKMIKSIEISEGVQIHPTLTTNSHQGLKDFVKAGGAALVTSFLMREEIQKGEVSVLKIETDDPVIFSSEACLLTKKDKVIPEIAEELLTRTQKLSIFQSSVEPPGNGQ